MEKMTHEELNDMFRCRKAMKLIGKVNTLLFWLGVIPGIALTAASALYVVHSLMNPASSTLLLIISMLLCGAYSWLMFSGIGDRSTFHMILAPIMMLSSSMVLAFSEGGWEVGLSNLQMLYSPIAIGVAVTAIITFRKYKYLSEQPGFPYFDEALKMNDEASREGQFHSDYADNLREWQKTSTSDMEQAQVSGVIAAKEKTSSRDHMRSSDGAHGGDLTVKSGEKPRDYYAELRDREMKEKARLARQAALAKNAETMRKNQKMYRIPYIVYAVLCVPSIFAVPFLAPLFSKGDFVYALADGLVLKLAALVLAFIGTRKRQDVLCACAPVLLLMNAIAVRSPAVLWLFKVTKPRLNILWFIISAAVCALTLYANHVYRHLEKQYGFPYFNERMLAREQTEVKRSTGEVTDTKIKALERPAVNDMGIPLAPRTADTPAPAKNGYMDEL
jgi:hypothetical protein